MENERSGGKEASERRRFLEPTSRLMAGVVTMIAEGPPIDQVLRDEPDCVFLKSADSTVLYISLVCQKVFSKESLIVGRRAGSMFSETLSQMSKMPDSMIMSGCPHIMFDHHGHNEDGELLRMTTAKYSLLGLGHPSLAILSVTRIHEKLGDQGDRRVQLNTLSNSWSRF